MSRKKVIALLVVAALLAIEATAYGFVNPAPFASNPAFGSTGRHVRFDLSNVEGEAETIVGPLWDGGGDPGDPWACDDVYWSQEVSWIDVAANWEGHQGLFGIDNTLGTELVSGSLTFHVNNFPIPNWHKLVWDEIVYYESAGATLNHGLYTGPGPNILDPWVVDQDVLNITPLTPPDPGYMENLYGEIRPNPDWEEIKFDFFVPAGGAVYLDSFEIATLCDVPEPGTLVLVIMALLGVVAAAWRRR